jgi:Tfp pilus assembly protein PilX
MAALTLKRWLADEAGFALPSAIVILFVVTILTGAAIAVATQTSTSTSRDKDVKAEIEAAEAGLHVASYRLSQLKPGVKECIGEGKAFTSEGECKDSPESLGNSATFQYWTTLPLSAGAKCAGRTVVSEASITQRCVTAEGIVNSVNPGVRLQVMVAGAGGEALFSVKGVVGLKKVLVTGSANVPGVVASNGEIHGEGSANFEQGFEFCLPAGSFKPAAGEERKKSGVKIAGKNPEAVPALEKTRSAAECPIKAPVPASHPTPESNEDSRIGAQDKFEGAGYTWNSAKYELTMESTAKLTMGEAGKTTTYFFCSFIMPGGGPEWKIAPGAKVEIYIGNHEEYPTKCAEGSGTFEIAGGSKTVNEAKNPGALLIMIGGKGPFKFANGSGKTLEASIYAPNAQVKMEGGVIFKGGIVGEEVSLQNGTKFEWSEETGKLGGGGAASSYSRKTWEQCTPGSGASEGC